MITLMISILALAIAAGQLIKISLGANGGITLLDVVVALFCSLGIIKLRFKLKKPPQQIFAALIFAAAAAVSLMLTSLNLKITDYLVSFSYTLRFLLYVFFAWLLYSGAFGNLRKNIDRALILSGIVIAILGLLQFIFYPNLDFLAVLGWDPHYFRTASTFFDPNFVGAFFVLTLILISQSLKQDKKWGLIFFIIIYVALLTTFSRSSYLMFLISGLILSFFKRSKLVFISTVILFAILMLGFRTYTQAVAKPKHIDRSQSASFRLNTWQQGLILFQKAPILGVGYNAYRYGLRQYNLGDNQFLQSHGSSSNDSSLLSVLSTTGFIGFAAYLYFLFKIFKNAGEKNLSLRAGLIGLIIHSFFANSLFYPPILAWILIISITSKK